MKERRGLLSILLYVVGGLLILAPLTYLAYYLWGPVGFLFVLLPLLRKPFDRAVEKVTGGYAAILRRIVTRRTLTMAVVGGFSAATVGVNLRLASEIAGIRKAAMHNSWFGGRKAMECDSQKDGGVDQGD